MLGKYRNLHFCLTLREYMRCEKGVAQNKYLRQIDRFGLRRIQRGSERETIVSAAQVFVRCVNDSGTKLIRAGIFRQARPLLKLISEAAFENTDRVPDPFVPDFDVCRGWPLRAA